MRLAGADPRARIEALDRLPGSTNYFLGERQNWKTDVPGYGRVRSKGVYPGIDMQFHGESGRLEYDFVLAPGASPESIRIDFQGQRSLRLDRDGDLLVETEGGEVRWKHPEVYQEVEGRRIPVDGRFVLRENRVRFKVAAYDRRRTLVIDPALVYSTYLGGASNDGVRGIAVDPSGNVYVVGNTTTTNLPVTPGVFQPTFGGQTAAYQQGDAFVAKFSPSGSLIYLSYLGGSADDTASAVAVDSAGNAYVTGCTTSTNFPIAGTPFQSKFGGADSSGSLLIFGDAFVTKISPTGNELIYSTYLGGSQDDFGDAIALDSSGNVYVAGATRSTNFPVTMGAYQGSLAGVGGQYLKETVPLFEGGDVFVSKLDPNGSHLIFSTYLGGSKDDVAFTLALDAANNIYVGGYTLSTDFPVSQGAYQTQWGGSEIQNNFFTFGDGFVSKLNAAGSALLYSTYFGGQGDDCVAAIAVDAAGNAYFTGSTSTDNWKTTPGAFQQVYGGYYTLPFLIEQLIGDAYVAKLNPTGTALVYMSYLGGNANDGGTGIAIDSAGNAYVTGFADSSNFPVTANALQPKMAGDGGQINGSYYLYGDAFLAVVNPTATALIYSSYFGGSFDDGALGIALEPNGTVHIAGLTISTNFPVTSNAFQKAYGGVMAYVGWTKGDAFVSTFSGLATSGPFISSVSNAFGGSTTIAPNTWVAVKGSGLAPDARMWGASDFVNNQLPAALDGAGVTMNGEKAYIYYISGTQINALTPPDLAPGPVQVQVFNGSTTSSPVTVQSQAMSPSLFVFDTAGHIVAQHVPSYGDVGPTDLYPGLTTPALPGEEIVLYANGLGQTSVPVVAGSESQGGTLATLPQVQVNGVAAEVIYAGLAGPGLYQVNFYVPANTPSGDVSIVLTYQGQNTQTGTVITIQ